MADDTRWNVVQEESPSTVEFDTFGDTIIGTYLGSEIINLDDGDSFKRYLVRQESDGQLLALNASYRLAQAFDDMKPDTLVKVEYVKNIDTGMPSPMKDFRVSIAQ